MDLFTPDQPIDPSVNEMGSQSLLPEPTRDPWRTPPIIATPGQIPENPFAMFHSQPSHVRDAIEKAMQHLGLSHPPPYRDPGMSVPNAGQSLLPIGSSPVAQNMAQSLTPTPSGTPSGLGTQGIPDINSLAPNVQDAIRKSAQAKGLTIPGANPSGNILDTVKPNLGISAPLKSANPVNDWMTQVEDQYRKLGSQIDLEGPQAYQLLDDVYTHVKIDPKTGQPVLDKDGKPVREPYELPKPIGIEKMIGGKRTGIDIGTLILSLVAASMGKQGQLFAGGLFEGVLGAKKEGAEARSNWERAQYDQQMQARANKAQVALQKLGFDQTQQQKLAQDLIRLNGQLSAEDIKKQQIDATKLNKEEGDNLALYKKPIQVNAKPGTVSQWYKDKRDAALRLIQLNPTLYGNIEIPTQEEEDAAVARATLDSNIKQDQGTADIAKTKASTAGIEQATLNKKQQYNFLSQMNPLKLKNIQNRNLQILANTSYTNEKKTLLANVLAGTDPSTQAKIANIYSEISNRGMGGLIDKDSKQLYSVNHQFITNYEAKKARGDVTTPDEDATYKDVKAQNDQLFKQMQTAAKNRKAYPPAKLKSVRDRISAMPEGPDKDATVADFKARFGINP